MEVRLQQLSKSFENRTILDGIDLQLKPGERTLISGPNGTGKSTLLKLIAGFLRPSSGSVEHIHRGEKLEEDNVYRYNALSAPYLRLPAELTVMENIRTWEQFRGLQEEGQGILSKVRLEGAEDRPIRELSSGMQQRLKLGIAFYTDAPLLLLDEPLTNLDAEGRELYHRLLSELPSGRTVLICSNDPEQEGTPGAKHYILEKGGLRKTSS